MSLLMCRTLKSITSMLFCVEEWVRHQCCVHAVLSSLLLGLFFNAIPDLPQSPFILWYLNVNMHATLLNSQASMQASMPANEMNIHERSRASANMNAHKHQQIYT